MYNYEFFLMSLKWIESDKEGVLCNEKLIKTHDKCVKQVGLKCL